MKNRVLRKIFIIFLSLALAIVPVRGVFASDDERQSLEEYLEELKAQIEANNQFLDDIYNNIYEVNSIIADNNARIEELEVSLADQRASMMKRIQYMYEAGANMDILLAIITSDSISDYLNKASYISQMVSYDREMLDNYVATLRSIDETQIELENRRTELLELKDSFEDAKYDSALALEEATVRLAEYDIEASQVQEVIEEYLDVPESTEVPDISELIDIVETEADKSSDEGTKAEDSSKEETEESATVAEEETTTEAFVEEITTEVPEEVETESVEEVTEAPEEGEDDASDSSVDYYVPISTYGYSEQEIYDLARVTYLEDGCVYPEGSYRSVYLCACVILNRANAWYGGSISSAIYASGQYATAYKYTSWGGGTLVINDITWQAVSDALSNCDPNPYYQCNGDHLAGSGLTEYYRDPVTNEVFYYPY